MNNERREAIRNLIARAEELKSMADTLKDDIQSVLDEEQDYYDNMPESFQGGEKGDRAQEAINNLETAVDCFDSFDELTGSLEAATA